MTSGSERRTYRIELYGTGHGWLESPTHSAVALGGVLGLLESMLDDPLIGRIEIVRVTPTWLDAETMRRVIEESNHQPFYLTGFDEEMDCDSSV